jgi:hypothetical protein
MSSATEQIIKVEEQILETLTNLQKPVLDAVKSLADKIEGRVPEVPGSDNLPELDLDELIHSQFAFAEKLLANQKAFANALIDAVKTVGAKAAPAPKAKPKPTTKAA